MDDDALGPCGAGSAAITIDNARMLSFHAVGGVDSRRAARSISASRTIERNAPATRPESQSQAKGRVLPAGSFYYLPANMAHFAWAGPQGAIVQIHGVGPSGVKMIH
jgi:hypothetical protein